MRFKVSIIGGVLIVALSLFMLGTLNLLNTSAQEAEDCGEIMSGRYSYENLICESGSPNINAEKDEELRASYPKIINLQASASAEDIEKAICFYATKDEATRNRAMDVYRYKYLQYQWEKKQKNADLIIDLFFKKKYCVGHYSEDRDNYDVANMTMEERYRECVSIKRDLPSQIEIYESLMKDDEVLGGWYLVFLEIKEERRRYLSQRSINLIEERNALFDSYQILQCELNFPVLKDPEPDSNSVPEEPWTPSGVV
jgi:hypothetical protein